MENANLKKTTYSMICALCIAASAVLQLAFSALGTNCALYLSVLICAMCCPVEYGVCTAVISPFIALLEAGSPAAVLLPAEIGKCLVFVITFRFLLGRIRTQALYDRLYACLVPAVCMGQIAGGLICAAMFSGNYNSAIMFVAAKLVAAIPEIVVLFALLTGTIPLLKTAGLLEAGLPAEPSEPAPDANKAQTNKNE